MVANTLCLGLIPFLGYHHVLMILIAIAIILLCKATPSSRSIPGMRANVLVQHFY